MRAASVTSSTIIVVILTGVSAVLGFGRESLVAYQYGSNALTDAYYVAGIIPDMVASWIAYALTNAMIPVLKRLLSISTDEGKKLIGAIIINGVLGLVIVSVVTFLLRSQLLTVLAPGFKYMIHQRAVELLSIMVWGIVFSGLSGILWGIHNALDNFSYPALVGIANNVVFLVLAIGLKPFLGLASLAVAFSLGVTAKFFIQLLPFLKTDLLRHSLTPWHPDMMKVLKSIPPIFTSSAIISLNLIVDRVLASGLSSGDITNLNYASKLGLLPSNLISQSMAMVLYARFITYSQAGNDEALQNIFRRGIAWTIFVGITVGTIFVCVPADTISVLFHHGAFSNNDVKATGELLSIYGWLSPMYLIPPVLIHLFYARNRNYIVTMMSITLVLINIIGSILLVRPLGVSGLVISNGVAEIMYVVIAFWLVFRDFKWSVIPFVRYALVTSLTPAVGFIIGVFAVSKVLFTFIPTERNTVLSFLILCAVFAGGMLGLYLFMLAFPQNRITMDIKKACLSFLKKTQNAHQKLLQNRK